MKVRGSELTIQTTIDGRTVGTFGIDPGALEGDSAAVTIVEVPPRHLMTSSFEGIDRAARPFDVTFTAQIAPHSQRRVRRMFDRINRQAAAEARSRPPPVVYVTSHDGADRKAMVMLARTDGSGVVLVPQWRWPRLRYHLAARLLRLSTKAGQAGYPQIWSDR